MHDAVKNRLSGISGTILFLTLAMFVVVLTVEKLGFLDSREEEKTLPITAEGRVSARPDVGRITFSVVSEGKIPKIIQDENAKKINEILDFLKAEGVGEEDITTSEFSLQPRYYYPHDYPRIPCPLVLLSGEKFPCPPSERVIIGYTLSQSLSVKIHDLKKSGAVVSGAIERGANMAGDLVFAIEDSDSYKKQARELAMTKAKGQAEDLARLGGFKIGKVISIQEGYSYFPSPYIQSIKGGLGGDLERAAVAPEIQPGSQDVVVTLTVVFEIR